VSPPRAIIAEDEANLRAELREGLAELWPELVVCAEARDGLEATRALERERPNVLFLDIEMPGMSGLDVARSASGRCHVVFVTAYDKYAVAAFDRGAVDYVMKPFSAERLQVTVERLKARIDDSPAKLDELLRLLVERVGKPRDYVRWITASQGNEVRLVTVDEISYFQSHHKYTLVVTGTRELLIRRTVKELCDELDPDVFWQIHRGTLVNVNAIAGLVREPGGQMRVRLKTRKEMLPVSGPFMHRFRQM
jgi:DNA-binding LytR/AlgR family response regulator